MLVLNLTQEQEKNNFVICFNFVSTHFQMKLDDNSAPLLCRLKVETYSDRSGQLLGCDQFQIQTFWKNESAKRFMTDRFSQNKNVQTGKISSSTATTGDNQYNLSITLNAPTMPSKTVGNSQLSIAGTTYLQNDHTYQIAIQNYSSSQSIATFRSVVYFDIYTQKIMDSKYNGFLRQFNDLKSFFENCHRMFDIDYDQSQLSSNVLDIYEDGPNRINILWTAKKHELKFFVKLNFPPEIEQLTSGLPIDFVLDTYSSTCEAQFAHFYYPILFCQDNNEHVKENNQEAMDKNLLPFSLLQSEIKSTFEKTLYIVKLFDKKSPSYNKLNSKLLIINYFTVEELKNKLIQEWLGVKREMKWQDSLKLNEIELTDELVGKMPHKFGYNCTVEDKYYSTFFGGNYYCYNICLTDWNKIVN